MKEKVSRLPLRTSLFWDVNPKTIDLQKHARYVIERILEFGNESEVRWMLNHYSHRQVRRTLDAPRGVLHKKTKTFWSMVLK